MNIANKTIRPKKVETINSKYRMIVSLSISISTVDLIAIAAVVTGVLSEAASYIAAAILVNAGLTFFVKRNLATPFAHHVLTATVVAFLVGSVSVPTPLLILFSQRKLSNAVANRAST